MIVYSQHESIFKCMINLKQLLNKFVQWFANQEYKQPVPKVKTKKKQDPLTQLEDFFQTHYKFRYNRLTGDTELRSLVAENPAFRLVTDRVMNSLCIEARKIGIDAWDRDVSRYLHSENISEYHPFHLYMEQLPKWDGTDRITELALRVSDEEIWVKSFHRWMLALTAQWLDMNKLHANSLAPVLISSEQGKQKSTFCKLIMPTDLQDYYTDSYDLSAQSSAEQKLASFGLINLDEIDKYSPKKMVLLKNILQMAGLNIKKAYKKNFTPLPRIASFIGTSNRKDLLTDPTGSRRFLCIALNKTINCSPIDHAQIYAQLKAELESGERYWFTSEEERKIMKHNKAFYRSSIEEDVFRSCFRTPTAGDNPLLLTVADIFQELLKHNPVAMRGVTARSLATTLLSIGVERVHLEIGNVYRIVRK